MCIGDLNKMCVSKLTRGPKGNERALKCQAEMVHTALWTCLNVCARPHVCGYYTKPLRHKHAGDTSTFLNDACLTCSISNMKHARSLGNTAV